MDTDNGLSKKAPADEIELRSQQAAAHDAWDEISKKPEHELQAAANAWADEHGHLFYWCCGSPVFGGASAEEYYADSDYYERGDRHGASVWYAG